jgi:ribosomal protein S18 acetylase RimI-like enzyme
MITLAEAEMRGLELLFDEQCAEWLALLRWDYAGPSRLIRQVARQRELLGFAAISGSTAVGFAYYVIEGERASIGDVYVSHTWRGAGVDRQLVAAILDEIEREPQVRRVESQCVSIANDAATSLLEARGFEHFERYYMMADLARSAPPPTESPLPASGAGPDVNIRAWKDQDFATAARVIHRSYRGQYDSRINSQYTSEDGCAELLTILTDHIWCGNFLPHVSRVAVRHSGHTPVGVLIGSRLAPRAGHIGQISVHPAYQGRGLGRRLIESAFVEFERYGFSTVSLAVTAANLPALSLYQSCGFRRIHAFPVFYRE